MAPPDNQYKIFSAVENKVTEASAKVLKNALQYDTDGKSGETIKVYQEYAMVSGVTSDTINSRIRSIQNVIGDYLKSVDEITKKAVETHATQVDIRNIQWAKGAAAGDIEKFGPDTTSYSGDEDNGSTKKRYNEAQLKYSLSAHKGIYTSEGKEISVYDLVKDIQITNRFKPGDTVYISEDGKKEFSRQVTETLEGFQQQKIDRAQEYVDQISDAQTKLQSALDDLNYTEKDIRDGKIPRPSPGVSSFMGLDAAAKGKVDLTKLGTATLGSLPEVVAGKNPADLTKTATEKSTTSSDDTSTTTEEKKEEGTQNQAPSTPGNSGGTPSGGRSGGGTGGDRSGRPGGKSRGGDKKSSDSGSGGKNGKSADEILSQLAQASQQATTGVMNAAAPVVNPALNAMGMPGIGQPGGIGHGMPGISQTMPMGGMGSMFGAPGMGSQFGAPGMGAPGAGSQFGSPGIGAPGSGAPGSNLGGGLGGQNHTAPTVGAPSQARVDPTVGQQLRADSAQAMKNTDNLVRDTAKKLDDTAQKLEDEAKAKDKEAAEKKPPAPEDKPKPEDKPAGEQPPAPEGEKKPEGDAAPAPEGEKNPEGDKPADEGAGDNVGETEQPAPEGEEAPPEGGDDAADNPEENPDAGTGEPPAEDPSVHVEATGTITRDGVTFQVDDARIAAVVDGINPQDGSTAIPLREAVINAGFNVPESGPMGTPVSPTDVQPGDIIVAAGAEGVLTGEGSVITANGKMALSDVASFENPEDGIYRL